MPYKVTISPDAEADFHNLIDYISEHDSPEKAAHVFTRIDEALTSLSEFPERGSHPSELLEIGEREYREIFFKPYRLIYRVQGKEVRVLLIADGRRDMRTLLRRRLLEY